MRSRAWPRSAVVYRVPYGLIFQDLMGLAGHQSGVTGDDRVAAAVRRIARRAEGVAIIAEGFRAYFQAGGVAPQKIVRLRNWTRRGEPNERREHTRARLGSLPSKLTSYSPAARPVVAAVAPDSETAREIATAQARYVVAPENPAALRDALLALRRDRSRASALGQSARRYANTDLSAHASLQPHEQFVLAVASRSVNRTHNAPITAAP